MHENNRGKNEYLPTEACGELPTFLSVCFFLTDSTNTLNCGLKGVKAYKY